jgi:hypothetical protein
LLVKELPSANNCACILDARREAERAQHAHTIRLDQESGSQSLLALDEFRREAVPMQSCGRGEASYSSADDQDRVDLCHGSLRSRRTGSTYAAAQAA